MVTETIEVCHVSNLGWELELINYIRANHPQSDKTAGRRQRGCLLERIPETKVYNFEHWAIQGPGQLGNHRGEGRGQKREQDVSSNSTFTLLCCLTTMSALWKKTKCGFCVFKAQVALAMGRFPQQLVILLSIRLKSNNRNSLANKV